MSQHVEEHRRHFTHLAYIEFCDAWPFSIQLSKRLCWIWQSMRHFTGILANTWYKINRYVNDILNMVSSLTRQQTKLSKSIVSPSEYRATSIWWSLLFSLKPWDKKIGTGKTIDFHWLNTHLIWIILIYVLKIPI